MIEDDEDEDEDEDDDDSKRDGNTMPLFQKKPRVILHVDMDAFFVSVEQLRRPWLRGKPVAVGGERDGRGVIASASYEARRYGVRAAMSVSEAAQRCPHCVFLPCSFDAYAESSTHLFSILDRYAADVEPLSMEEAYLDLGGASPRRDSPLHTAEQLHREITRSLGLSSSMGIASNKLVAKISSRRAKPNGILYAYPGYEQVFLSPLPVRLLPGVGPRTARELNLLGIRTIGDLHLIGEKPLVRVFGSHGARLYGNARAEDRSPVTMPHTPKSVSRETTFPVDILDRNIVRGELSLLTGTACRSLRRKDLSARTVTLKLRYADFVTVTQAHTLHDPTACDDEIFSIVVALMKKAWTRRVRIRLVGITLSHLAKGDRQLLLFGEEERKKRERLYAGLDTIRERHGSGAIISGTTLAAVHRL